MVRPIHRYVKFKGRRCWKNGATYVHLGDLMDWLLVRFSIHIRWFRQTEADEVDAITDGLDDTELD